MAGDTADDQRDPRALFDELWANGDPWDLDTSEHEQRRYDRQVGLLDDRRYRRALELGCASGSFTQRLVPLCDRVVAVDIAEAALERSRARGLGETVELRHADIMEMDVADGAPWDLVVLAETAYYLGWARPLYDVGWLARTLREAMADGGRLLLVNTLDRTKETSILSPWLVRTYRDLFLNTGFRLEREETQAGEKDTVHFEVLMSLMTPS